MWSDLARFRYGQMCERGEGVPKNIEEAVHLYSGTYYLSNEPDLYPKGYISYTGPTSQSIENLLRLWAQGRGVPSQMEKNMQLYKDPASLLKQWASLINTPMGEFYLGEIYYQGKLLPQDRVEAAIKFQIASGQKVDEASKMFNKVYSKLSPTEKDEVTKTFPVENQRFEMAMASTASEEQFHRFMSW